MKFLAEKMNGEFNGFWQLEERNGELICVNRFGGWHQYYEELGNDIYEVDKYEDLPFAKYYINDKYKTGWLDRNGRFYGCEWEMHDFVAEHCFGKWDKDLENEGWVKIALNVSGDKSWFSDTTGKYNYFYLSNWPMTVEQKNWLAINGFNIPDWLNERRNNIK